MKNTENKTFFYVEETLPIVTWKNVFLTIKTYNLSLTSNHIYYHPTVPGEFEL